MIEKKSNIGIGFAKGKALFVVSGYLLVAGKHEQAACMFQNVHMAAAMETHLKIIGFDGVKVSTIELDSLSCFLRNQAI